MSNPWDNHPELWPTKASFMSYVRGGIRRGLWEKNPVKLEFIKQNREKVPLGKKTKKNPEGMVWGSECALCNELFRQTECQVDHKTGNHSLREIDQIQRFIESIVFVTFDDLQVVCKGCHTIKSYAERKNITFEEAKLEKEVIAFGNKKVNEQKKILLEHNPKADVSNAAKRKEEYRRILNEKAFS